MNKNKDLLADFTQYCWEHPEERFWQALRNWAGVNFILTASGFDDVVGTAFAGIQDTFYWDKKNN